MWVSGGDDVEVDTHVQDDSSTPYQVVQVVAAEANQPEGEQSEDHPASDAKPSTRNSQVNIQVIPIGHT